MKMRSKKGFTLIEIIVTITIVAIVGAGLLSIFTQGFWIVSTAGFKSQADFKIQEAAEMIYSDSSFAEVAQAALLPQNVTTNIGETTNISVSIFTTVDSVEPSIIEINGKNITLECIENGRQERIFIFVP